MISREQVEGDMQYIADCYDQIYLSIEQNLKHMTTDTMEEIRMKMKGRQNRVSQEQNINLIEKEREKIVSEMREHIKSCFNPHCQLVDEVVIVYNLFKGSSLEKQDPIKLIVHEYIEGLPRKETDCPEGRKINERMRQTHKMIMSL